MGSIAVKRCLLGAGFLSWAVAAVGAWRSTPLLALPWLAVPAWLAFGVAFAVLALVPASHPAGRALDSRLVRVVLTVQALGALVLELTVRAPFAGMLLVVIAGELGLVARARTTGLWIGVQSTLFFFALGRWQPYAATAVDVASWVAFQLFAAGAGLLAQREAAARAELARVHAELLGTQALLADSARNAERLHISRELHDSLGHHLMALSLQLEVARNTASGNEAVLRAQEITREMLAGVRDVVSTLRSDATFDLSRALGLLLDGVTGLNVHLSLAPALERLDSARAHALFRSVQEAVTNTLRHAQAKALWIEVEVTATLLRLVVRDDGKGAPDGATTPGGHGLIGIRERIEALAGQVLTRSEPGGGFWLEVSLPYRGAP
ncbi:MAG: two-component system, sensor protein [Pseudomonadota bacterium]|jgi:signal transduction histidine kinase